MQVEILFDVLHELRSLGLGPRCCEQFVTINLNELSATYLSKTYDLNFVFILLKVDDREVHVTVTCNYSKIFAFQSECAVHLDSEFFSYAFKCGNDRAWRFISKCLEGM